MSNLKFVHSGGNSVSLTTPTSNPGSNVTFKLPAADGSSGQVLQTDGNGNLSWVTVTDTNDYVKISKAVNTGDTGAVYLDFANLDITTYKFFDLIGYFKPLTDATNLRLRFRTNSNSVADGSVYAYGFNEKKNSNTSNCTATQGSDKILLTGSVGSDTGEGTYLNLRVSFADSSDPTNAEYIMNAATWQATYREQGNDARHATGEGHYYSAADNLSGFSLYHQSGNMGDYSYCLYGMKR